ncbi:MAG: hypothetical protein JJE48_00755 [Actinobacteria bacterium]|nr:hypothetical protein [Actinomycetota bacterium]
MNKLDYSELAREALANIPVDDRSEILSKRGFSCETRWMMAMVSVAGWDIANKMNIEVGTAVAEGDMHRLMSATGKGKPASDEDFLFLVAAAMDLFTPKKYFEYEMKYIGPGKMLGIVRRCLAYIKVSSIGVERDYDCGCFGMRAGWYRAMGLEAKETLLKCMKFGDDRCEILVEYDLENT